MYALLLALTFSFFVACASPADNQVAQAPEPGWTHLSTTTGDLPAPGLATQQTASLVADLNLDGVNDFVIGCRQAPPSMVLYLRSGQSWDRFVIDSTTLPVEAGGAAHDIDGDGDPDIVMGGDSSSDQLWWWENPYPAFNQARPWTRRLIKSGGGNKHHDQIFGDFDGDGRLELVFWNQGACKLIRAAIPDDPTVEPWELDEVYSWSPDDHPEGGPELPGWADPNEHEGLAAADIDGDGVTDLVGGGRWFNFTGGGVEMHPIDITQHFTRSAAGQLVEGGRPEVVLVVGDGVGRVRMYQWTGARWAGRDLLGHEVWHGHSLQITDLNGDGHLDVFLAEMGLNEQNPDAKVYAFLGDGRGGFRTRIAVERFGNHESRAADLDGDGDIDILGKPYNWRTPRLDIWLNGGAAFEPDELPMEHIIIDQDGPADPHTKSAGDLDGDGIEDLVISSSAGGPIVWYRSPDREKFMIAPAGRWSCDAEVGDMDGDGDNDLVISEYYDKKRMEWYENPGPGADPSTWRWKLHAIGPPRAHDLELADLDGDGDLDIVSRSQSGFGTAEGNRLILWYHGTGDNWTQQVLDCPHGEGLALGDMDRDGFPDVVIGGKWFSNPGNEGDPWAEHTFADWHMDAVVKVADVNADGRLDALMTEAESTGELAWFEAPPDPAHSGWAKHVISPSLEKGHSLGAADLDNDGDLDVATAEMHQSEDPDPVLVFINRGDGLNWRRQVLSETGSHGIRLGDFDGDGDTDIFGANWKSVARDSLAYVELWRNNLVTTARLATDRWERHVIDPGKPWRAVFIDAADLDGDGDRDIVTGGWWYRNPGEPGGNWRRETIGEPLRNMAAVGDFNADGYPDILGTAGKGSDASSQFVWAVNKQGNGFEIKDNIPRAQGDFLQGIEVLNAGPTALVAVMSWHMAGQGIQAYIIPDDPVRSDWEWMKVTPVSQDEQVSAGDIDGDGDLDLLLGTIWLENSGDGSIDTHTLFETDESPDRNRLADINGDGRLDAVVGYEAINVPGKLAWYENPAEPRGLWIEHVVAEVVGPMSLDVADLDLDGDQDIVVGEHNYEKPATARLLVFSNQDGRGGAWRQSVVHTGDEHHDGAVTVDIDNDGDLDIISIGWSHPRVLLYENKAMHVENRVRK